MFKFEYVEDEIVMTRSKKSILKSIHSFELRIEEHQKKIFSAMKTGKNEQFITHWEKEIKNFLSEIKKLKDKLKK